MSDATRKAAIVTGSATGVGAATVLGLAARGWNVVINYSRSEKQAHETAARARAAGADVRVVRGDIAELATAEALAGAAIEAWGRLDAVVNNAGTTTFARQSDLAAVDAADFARIYAVNVVGAFQMCQVAAPHLKAGGDGAIVNISSIAGVTGIGSSIAYAASKGALNTLTISLARVIGPEIRVNAICPGMVTSRWLRDGLGDEIYENLKKGLEDSLPLAKVSTPEDVAEAAIWLIEGAGLVTGNLLLLDGGQHLGYAPLVAR